MSDTTPNYGTSNPETDGRKRGEDDDSAGDTGESARPQDDGHTGTGSHAALGSEDAAPDPVSAEGAKRETYVSQSTVGDPDSLALADDYGSRERYPEYQSEFPTEQQPTQQQTPIYVQAPIPPRMRGNRGVGVLIALLAAAVYAFLFALVVLIIAGVNSNSVVDATGKFAEFAVRPVYYVPVIAFFVAFALLIALVNRGGWWAYVLFGFVVAVVVYFSYIGGALLTVEAWNLTPSAALKFISTQWLNPGAIAAAVIAREVPIWAGAWIARHGQGTTARNAEARAEYDRQIAEGPELARS